MKLTLDLLRTWIAEAKFTRRPWVLEMPENVVRYEPLGMLGRSFMVADCRQNREEDPADRLPEEVVRANACLVATAPDLLDGLFRVLVRLEKGGEFNRTDAIRICQSLIAQALGKATP